LFYLLRALHRRVYAVLKNLKKQVCEKYKNFTPHIQKLKVSPLRSRSLLFSELAVNAGHLRPSDVPLLASYVQATIAARRYARDPSTVDLWEKAVRLQAMLATKLRLTAQSRVDPKKLGRKEPLGPTQWD